MYAPLCTFSLVEDGRRLGVPQLLAQLSEAIAAQAAFELKKHDVTSMMEELTRQISNLSALEMVVQWVHVGHIIMTPVVCDDLLVSSCFNDIRTSSPMNLGIAMVASYVAALEGLGQGCWSYPCKRIRRKFAKWLFIIWIHLLQRLWMFSSSLIECNYFDFMDSSCWIKSHCKMNFRETSLLISFQS